MIINNINFRSGNVSVLIAEVTITLSSVPNLSLYSNNLIVTNAQDDQGGSTLFNKVKSER